MTYRIIVFGSRTWSDANTIYNALAVAHAMVARNADLVVVHGHCPTGADAIAEEICRMHLKIRQEQHPALWGAHGRAAGPIRNEEMCALGADLVLGFRDNGDSPGTDGMRILCQSYGLAKSGLWYTCRNGGVQIEALDGAKRGA